MKTWEECYRDPLGTLYADETLSAPVGDSLVSVRYRVMRGPYNLNAYVGVPLDHPSAGWSYDLLPLDVHGGFTFGEAGREEEEDYWPSGWWWYGWDYGHAGDRNWIEFEMRAKGRATYPSRSDFPMLPPEREWGVAEVVAEAKEAAEDLLRLAAQGWLPPADEVAEDDERRRRFKEWRKGLGSGEAVARLERDAQKAQRLRELEG